MNEEAPAPEAPTRGTAEVDGPAEVVDALMWAAQLLVAISARSLAAVESEVSLPQLRVLVVVASQGGLSLQAVADHLGIHPSNATRACDKLVARGLLARREDSVDRRVLRLTLTDPGHHLVSTIMEHRRDQVEQLVSRIPEGQRRALAAGLTALVTADRDTLHRAAWQAGWPTRAVAADQDPVSGSSTQ